MKFTTVAIIPTAVAAPNFLIHQTVTESVAKPTISHKMGNPDIRNTIGANIEFNMPQRPENIAMAATARLSK
jgi:hypothetical protein